MKAGLIFPCLLALTEARAVRSRRGGFRPTDIYRREVPQEHSHEQFLVQTKAMLDLNNPLQIEDSVFALLGNAAAAAGAGQVKDLDCLQQIVADQAFSNAKAIGNVDGMVAALVFRTLERNTAKVGLASADCQSVVAVNEEIAVLQQHQDAAVEGASERNREIEINLAEQITIVGGDANIALQSATFAAGNPSDSTGAGNSCDDANDAVGCIISGNKLAPAASAQDIQNAAAAANVSAAANQGLAASNSSASANGSADAAAQLAAQQQAAQQQAAQEQAAQQQAAQQQAAQQQAAQQQAAQQQAAQQQAAQQQAAQQAAQQQEGLLSFGSCGSPELDFTEEEEDVNININIEDSRSRSGRYESRNRNDFDIEDVNINVVTQFVCVQLNSRCRAPQNTLDACNQGAQQAEKLAGKAASDAFNQALKIVDQLN